MRIGWVNRYGVYAQGDGYNIWDHLDGEFVREAPISDLGQAWQDLTQLVETLYWQKKQIWFEYAKYPKYDTAPDPDA